MNKRGGLFGFLQRAFLKGKPSHNPFVEMSMLRVKDYMSRDVMTIDRNKSLIQAAHTMIGAHISCLVVTDETKPKGILTERDFIKKLPMGKEPKSGILVDEIMTEHVVSVAAGVSLFEAQRIMKKHSFRKLVVADKGELIGIITQTDLCRAVADLKTYIQDSPLVKDVMTRNPITFSSEDGFLKVKGIMSQKGVGSVIIADEGEIKGMFTEFDIVSEFFMNPNRLKNSCMRELMTSPVVCVSADFEIDAVNRMMIERNFRRLPVIEDGKLVGIITQTDVARALYTHFDRNKEKKYPKKWLRKGADYHILKKDCTILYEKKEYKK